MSKIIKCAFCGGTGMDPYDLLSPSSYCLVCDGTGLVSVQEPVLECLFCAGSGKNPLGSRVPCIVCGGKGNVTCESTTKCNQCKGSGKSGDGLPCSRCGGKGFKWKRGKWKMSAKASKSAYWKGRRLWTGLKPERKPFYLQRNKL